MSIADDSPSAGRRKALKESDAANQLRVLESCPLSKYVDIADRLLDHFQHALDGRRLDEAYIFGLRFANLCLSSLPQHPEWKCDTRSKCRKRLTSQVGDVLCMMDIIKQRMDAEELMKIKAEMIAREEEEDRKKEAEDSRKHQLEDERRREQQKRNTLEEERAQFLAEQRSQRKEEIEQNQSIAEKKETITKKNEIEQSAMAKLYAMQAQMTSTEHTDKSETKEEVSAAVATKKKIEQSKSAKTKAKEGNKLKKWFSGAKQKSNSRKDEEMTILSSSRQTPSGSKDDTTKILLTAAVTEDKVVMTKKTAEIIAQQHHHSHGLERKQPQQEIMEKTSTMTHVEKDEKKIESSSNTISTKSTVKSKKSKKEKKNESSSQTISPTRTAKSKKSTGSIIANGKIANKKKQSLTTSDTKVSEEYQQSPNGNVSVFMAPSSTLLPPSAEITLDGAVSSTTATIIAAQQTPQSRKEKATIDKLKQAISIQEDRLEEIEGKQIPSLLRAAKAFLKEKNKKEALKCLAHKKRLENQVDSTKGAVFNMETQMFMLESAFEDRHVKKALDEAASAIAGYQQSIGDPNAVMVDLTNMSASLPELEFGDDTDEELMEELEEWMLSPEEKRKSKQKRKDAYADDDDISLLSMPTFLPVAPVATPTSPSVDRLLSVIIGR